MPDTFNSSTKANADATLPPLTASLRKLWSDATPYGARVDPGPAWRALLDVVHDLEQRVIDLEG
ncbi:hypothetical protein [Nocardia farcinica]|uniref:Uncharacterized protein n=1 Tax=Nocardia farcinica TaxID=37329 RepID=A0A0H5NRU9_NOCFR|nr:hypothetical protein [Nocardia farcinica]SLJ75086.1 Uncharacterised protein [Mycobacteroides abscessus subsp. abscessus]AXK85816.1 hypothetical protein DXT66_09400 [Nocardia farcinica]MBF6233768.1 hypothetical protein [Nocardia farcinica]MBF6522231.1 hypothetical protein [Nocardia farcinica]PFW98965.1 hypothetical protein CJ469_05701 [Nocardia farcinica]